MPYFLEHLVKVAGWDLNSPNLVVATANAGLYELIRYQCWSDYYGVMERDSPKLYGRMYNDARDNHGTRIVTSSLAMLNIAKIDPDIVLEITGWSDSHVFERGEYITGATTGSHLIQLAVNFGAKYVTLIGMEGYKSTPSTQVIDTFDGRKGPKFGHKHTKQWYGPLMQQVVVACPDVQFEFYGRLEYPMEGKNVVLISEKQLQEASLSPENGIISSPELSRDQSDDAAPDPPELMVALDRCRRDFHRKNTMSRNPRFEEAAAEEGK